MRDYGALRRVSAALADAASIVVLTGAGMSAASGVPTFRGAGGLWRTFRAEDLATRAAFARDAALVWEWYDWRRQQIAACAPNAGHEVLARWSETRDTMRVITQNVDGLHERAGTRHVRRLHGSIWRLRCVRGCPAGGSREVLDVPLAPLPPRCECGAVLRPDVVWFGESLDPAVLDGAVHDAQRADVFLTVGTSSQVYPAAGLVPLAHAAGALVVEINPEPAASADAVDVRLTMGADQALMALDLLLHGAMAP
jgi:NAD-dependent deacetylase